MQPQHQPTGELRQDPITEKWVVIATERAKRLPTEALAKEGPTSTNAAIRYKADCPFCNLAKYPQKPDILRLPDDETAWQMHIFQNKYPAFNPSKEFHFWNDGPYLATTAVGH
ncbi:MAG: hypothetical protein O3A36_02705, partial [bacterium]|nr:hypothetical protein [bacterium]